MLTWLLRNTKPQTSFLKVTGNGLGQNNLSQFWANTMKEEVAEQLDKLLQSTTLLTPNKEEGFRAEFLLCKSNAHQAMKSAPLIAIRDLYHDLQISCALLRTDLPPVSTVIQQNYAEVKFLRKKKKKKKVIFNTRTILTGTLLL
jgi:hydroxymethylpyrimidine/phosphomethylpyrimidine kinase